jgi:hypothetical protein
MQFKKIEKRHNQNSLMEIGDKMSKKKTQNRDYDALGWGAFFIWWGITELLPGLPKGTGALGIGLILLGVNAARYASGVATSRFTISLGILAALWGGLELAGAFLSLPFEIPVFAILLMALGGMILFRAIRSNSDESMGGLQ